MVLVPPLQYDNIFIGTCVLCFIFLLSSPPSISLSFSASFFFLDSDDDDLPSDDYRTAMAYRRRSVFAEAYVPGGDDETDKVN